ncbi:MAG TPA: glyoxalase [Hyphomicrobiales bacterium]|nr:glyoxalase [Hyphomicrobiales bacterium]
MFGLGRSEQGGQQGGEQGGVDHVAVAILPVSDMAAAQRFFERLGLRPMDDFGDEYAILVDGRGWQVHLKRAAPSFLKSSTPFGLYLYTQEVDQLAAQFGVRPQQTEWGTYEFTLQGPDGIEVQVGWPAGVQG